MLSHPADIPEWRKDVSVADISSFPSWFWHRFPHFLPSPPYSLTCIIFLHTNITRDICIMPNEWYQLVLAAVTRRYSKHNRTQITILSFFLDATKEFTSWKQIYWHVGSWYLKCCFPLCYHAVADLTLQAYIKYQHRNFNTWVLFQTSLSTQFSTLETREWLKGSHYC